MIRCNVAIIGGSGLEQLLEDVRSVSVKTPYGKPSALAVGSFDSSIVAFLSRHGRKHEYSPHMINYRANIWVLKKLGVERVVSTNAVGAINKRYRPGDICIPTDIIDFTKSRTWTFYNGSRVVHVDSTEPYCTEISKALHQATIESARRVWYGAVMVATEGPRFETPAEIRMLKSLNCDIVSMTASPEVFLSRELEMCYGSVCYVSNMAAGLQRRLTTSEVREVAESMIAKLQSIIRRFLVLIPKERGCICGRALHNALM